MFQSPCGEVVMKGFVPMAFQTAQFHVLQALRHAKVSVPLRGSGDERRTPEQNTMFGTSGFQSPCGEVVMKACSKLRPLFIGAFQSPCGEVVMKGVA
jgi:hypothetical protein